MKKPTEEEIIKVLDEGKVRIKSDKYTALRTIKEKSLRLFYKRFAPHRLEGSKRQRRRQLESWLDKQNVRTWALNGDKIGYYVFIPEQKRCLFCNAYYSKSLKGYEYKFREVDKDLEFEEVE